MSVAIEDELEVAELEGVTELEGTPSFRPRIPMRRKPEIKCKTHLTLNTSIPTVEIKSSSS